MSSPLLEDACYWMDILEKLLTKEMEFLKALEDP